VTHSCLKCPTMDPCLKLKFPKLHEIEIYTFLFVFSAPKCHLSPRLGIVITKFSIFQDIFDCSKVAHSCLKCSSMDQWLKLMFPKLHEIRIWTFSIVFIASKCRHSPRLGIVISKSVYFQISLVVTKWLILVWSVQLWTHG